MFNPDSDLPRMCKLHTLSTLVHSAHQHNVLMTEFNVEQARANMIEQQIRTWEVLDRRVLEVIGATPRELFAPDRYKNLAFADMEIPLAHGEKMMAPKVEARMLQALDVQPTDTVLEIGAGSGFVTACLARLAQATVSVDLYEDFTAAAGAKLRALDIGNVMLETGDAADGWPRPGGYDVIAVTGSLPEYRDCFERSLKPGGRLFIVVGEPPLMTAMLVTRTDAGGFHRGGLFETALRPLINAVKSDGFMF